MSTDLVGLAARDPGLAEAILATYPPLYADPHHLCRDGLLWCPVEQDHSRPVGSPASCRLCGNTGPWSQT